MGNTGYLAGWASTRFPPPRACRFLSSFGEIRRPRDLTAARVSSLNTWLPPRPQSADAVSWMDHPPRPRGRSGGSHPAHVGATRTSTSTSGAAPASSAVFGLEAMAKSSRVAGRALRHAAHRDVLLVIGGWPARDDHRDPRRVLELPPAGRPAGRGDHRRTDRLRRRTSRVSSSSATRGGTGRRATAPSRWTSNLAETSTVGSCSRRVLQRIHPRPRLARRHPLINAVRR
jgi:hypothetical protein